MFAKEKLLELHAKEIAVQKLTVQQIETGILKTHHNGTDSTQESLQRAKNVIEILEQVDEFLKRDE